MSEGTELRAWLASRAGAWRELATGLAQRPGRGGTSVEESLALIDAYRGVARDLALARRLAPDSRAAAGLEAFYGDLHARITRRPRGGLEAFLTLLEFDVPAATAAVRGRIAAMAALMAASALAGWWLIETFPPLIGLIASESMIESVEQGHLWTEGLLNVTPSSVLSIGILANNITVSIFAFCAGIFLGLGTLYLVALNGLMLGGVFAFTHRHGLGQALFTFIVAHGCVELSVICVAGAAGITLGESIAHPRLPRRRDAFQECAHRTAPLLLACALLLVGCGFIEGFVSPDPQFPLASRVVIGVCYWLVMWALLTGRIQTLRRRRNSS